jgi:hypothetical protein
MMMVIAEAGDNNSHRTPDSEPHVGNASCVVGQHVGQLHKSINKDKKAHTHMMLLLVR